MEDNIMTNVFDGLKKHEFELVEYNKYKHGTKEYSFANDSGDQIDIEVSIGGLVLISTKGEITLEAMQVVASINWLAI